MPEVFAFQAVRYDPGRFGPSTPAGAADRSSDGLRPGDLSSVLAPPYDVLDESDRKALLARNEHNIVAIDLPFIPPKSAGPAELYRRAAYLLETWMREKVLIRDQTPAIYVYHQKFVYEGRESTRRMFIANVRLVPFSEGTVLPHEQTFGGPKEDRLALMKATRCQISPIFGMFSDSRGAVGGALEDASRGEPEAVGTLDGVENRLWVVTDAEVVRAVSASLRDRPIYIADGHHRYGTALLYRDGLRETNGGSLPPDHPANSVMFVLCSMEDPGCLILPYHRVLGEIDLDTLTSAWAAGTMPAEDGPPGPDGGHAASKADVRLWHPAGKQEVPLRFTNREVLRQSIPDQPPAWYELDYAYLHAYLIDKLLADAIGNQPTVHYVKSEEQARQTARDHNGVALLMNAAKMDHLRGVSEAGGLMPQKSTYFHPKLATGLTLHLLS